MRCVCIVLSSTCNWLLRKYEKYRYKMLIFTSQSGKMLFLNAEHEDASTVTSCNCMILVVL